MRNSNIFLVITKPINQAAWNAIKARSKLPLKKGATQEPQAEFRVNPEPDP